MALEVAVALKPSGASPASSSPSITRAGAVSVGLLAWGCSVCYGYFAFSHIVSCPLVYVRLGLFSTGLMVHCVLLNGGTGFCKN